MMSKGEKYTGLMVVGFYLDDNSLLFALVALYVDVDMFVCGNSLCLL